MRAHDCSSPGQPEPPSFTIDPLLTEGRTALTARPNTQIKRAMLKRLTLAMNDKSGRIQTVEGQDLSAFSPADIGLPRDARPISATIGLHIDGTTGTDELELIPPYTVKCKPTSHTAILLDWLAKTPLTLAHKLTHLSLILLLAIITALPAGFEDFIDDDDSDDDDDATDESAHTHTTTHKAPHPILAFSL